MKIRRAVITVAGRDQQSLPLQRLVDADGRSKSALAIIVEEAVTAGADEIALVIRPGDEAAFRAAAGDAPSRLELLPQAEPRGYGDAVQTARVFVGDEPFLHFVGDHLYVSRGQQRCAQQLVAVAESEACAVSAVQATREHLLPLFGAIGGSRIAGDQRLYGVATVVEKPTPTQAEQDLIVPGLRAGHYLCFFGIHVLPPTVFGLLAELGDLGSRQLSAGLALLVDRERYLAYEVDGSRYNLGPPYGLLGAQLAIALAGRDRDEVLTLLVDQLARSP
jgi:UTP--glucose-1-phosphate uridylyltransferase